MLNILSHQRNATQNNSEITSYICKYGQDQKHWWQLMLERMWGKGNTLPFLVGVQTDTAVLYFIMAISLKIRKQPSSSPSNTTFVIYPKNPQSYHKNMCSTMFIAALFVIARNCKKCTFPLTEEWIRQIVVHLHNGVLHSRKKIMISWNFLANWLM